MELRRSALFKMASTVIDHVLHANHPLTVQHFFDRQSLLRVKLEDHSNEVLEGLRNSVAEFVASFEHVFLDLIDRVASERGIAVHHFVQQDP